MLISITVNGRTVTSDVAARTHLGDYLREELLLTGTHLGCEHGVCGACTILLDDAPARSCIAYAAACNGARIRTIEGLEDDPIMVLLRDAFTRSHALQCGYCTPGMLVTARDIVLRLPDADDDRIRLELAGNLCRCTGYNGIVNAIRLVLDAHASTPLPVTPSLPHRHFAVPAPATAVPRMLVGTPGRADLVLALPLDLPPETVWPALRDPALIASCIPGATLNAVEGERVTGEMVTALGPIRARFTGAAQLSYDDVTQSGQVVGEGSDRGSGTRLSGTAAFKLEASASGSLLTVTVDYALQGPLAQLGRRSIVQAVAAEMAETVGQNLQGRLRGEAGSVRELSGFRFLARVLWRRVVRQLWSRGG